MEKLPEISQLPDPFLFTSGRRVDNRKQWRKRREEIKEILLRYEYGHTAPAPEKWSAREVSSKTWLGGRMTLVAMTLDTGAGNSLDMAVHVYRPAGDGPFPAVLNIGDDGSKAAVAFARGYMLVTCSPEVDLDPDTEGREIAGPAQLACPTCDWGSLAVWAWGASRAMDYLQTRRDVQSDHVIVRGHSRMGKAALLAGALDERFAMVAPNGSGTGGASAYRVRSSGAETLASITSPKRFASWFQRDFGRFGDRVDRLPFDQHWLLALVAPRPLLSTEAEQDRWANPRGNQAAVEAARHVYRFLGAADHIGIRIRPGGHENLDEDWHATLDFADWKLFGVATRRRFDHRWDTNYTPTYDWSLP